MRAAFPSPAAGPPNGVPQIAWQVPTRVLYGLGTAALIGQEVKRFGGRALVLTDGHLAERTTIVRDVCSSLAVSGVTPVLFTGVRPHPSLSTVRRGIEAVNESESRVVIGLGGGSSMDVAKVVAAAARNPELLDESEWGGRSGVVMPLLPRPRAGLPLIQVPTLAATSSEINAVASLVMDGTSKKKLLLHPMLYAQAAIVDPALTASTSNRQIAEGGLETLCRMLVPYITDPGGKAVQDRFSEGIMRVVLEYTPAALGKKDDLEARANLSSAVMNSMLGWTLVGRNPYGHVLWYLSNAIGTVGRVSKAQGMAALLPAYLDCVLGLHGRMPDFGHVSRLAELGRNVFCLDARGDAETARQTVELLKERVVASWELPASLGDVGMSGGMVPRLTEETFDLWAGPDGAIGWLTKEALTSFYRKAL